MFVEETTLDGSILFVQGSSTVKHEALELRRLLQRIGNVANHVSEVEIAIVESNDAAM